MDIKIRKTINQKLFLPILVVAILAAATFGVSVAATIAGPSAERHACSGTGGLRVVDEADGCKAGEQAISWSPTEQAQGSSAPQISIIFDGKGNIFKGTGFTVDYFGPGRYQINFPPGSLTAFPAPNVTPFSGLNVNATVTGLVGFVDGSGGIFIVVREPNGTLQDSALMVNVAL